jgi:hypothetical protein
MSRFFAAGLAFALVAPNSFSYAIMPRYFSLQLPETS